MELAVALVMITVIFGAGVALAGVGWYKNMQSDALRDKCNQLEYALQRYGQAHEVVDTSSESYDSEGKLHYNMIRTYPTSQANLSILHDLGFLHRSLKISDFQWTASGNSVIQDSSVVFYKVSNDYTKYKIEVTLPNGKKYTTPGSSNSL